jgi:hypothetical protein
MSSSLAAGGISIVYWGSRVDRSSAADFGAV